MHILKTHCLLLGRYSRKTVVSSIRFPPPPNPIRAIKNAREFHDGDAPDAIHAAAQMNSDVLKANRRPIISAVKPQNKAPISMPTYTEIVSARG